MASDNVDGLPYRRDLYETQFDGNVLDPLTQGYNREIALLVRYRGTDNQNVGVWHCAELVVNSEQDIRWVLRDPITGYDKIRYYKMFEQNKTYSLPEDQYVDGKGNFHVSQWAPILGND